MSAGERGRVATTIVAGFPGAGKTTWLLAQLRAGAFGRATAIVSDAARAPVDAALPGEDVDVVLGPSDAPGDGATLDALRRASAAIGGGAGAGRSLVVEAGGLADPAALREAIRADRELSQRLEIGPVVVVVDGVHGAASLRAFGLARRQVESADCLVVARLDAARRDEVAGLCGTLARLNPRAPVFGSALGADAPLPEAAAPPDDLPPGEPGEKLFATEIDVGRADWPTLSVWLSALLHARGDDVLRVKGLVRSHAGPLWVQSVRGAAYSAPADASVAGVAEGRLAVIGRRFTREALERSLDAFVAATRGQGA